MTHPPPALRFPFQRPELPPTSAWGPLLTDSYAMHRYSNHGPLALRLEQRMGARAGRPVVLAANGTAAITAALLALGRSGAVILPSFTFPATLGAIRQAGLKPVLADVNAQTWELDVPRIAAAARACGEPLAAVVGVRTFGLCRDWSAQQEWCAQHNVPLILDSAAALGGTLPDGRAVGQQGCMETFSLHATKVFAVGEGGAIACEINNVSRLRRVMNFGLQDGVLQGWGFNAKVSEFTAAIGLAQDAVFDVQLAQRRFAARAYSDFFGAHAPDWGLAQAPGDPPWQAFPVLAPSAALADRFEQAALNQGVQIRRYYRPALHTVADCGADACGQRLCASADLAERMICLPMYSKWAEGEHDRLLHAVGGALRECNV